MRRLLAATLLMVLCAAPAAAQVAPGDGLITLGGGWSSGSLKAGGTSVDGGMVGFAYDQLGTNNPVSFAFTFGYSLVDAVEDDESTGRVSRSVATWPLGLGARWWFGQSKVQVNLGAILAVYFSSIKTTYESTEESYNSVGTSGWGMQIPVGLAFNVSDSVVIGASYQLNWLWSNEALENDILHAVILSLGFKLS